MSSITDPPPLKWKDPSDVSVAFVVELNMASPDELKYTPLFVEFKYTANPVDYP